MTEAAFLRSGSLLCCACVFRANHPYGPILLRADHLVPGSTAAEAEGRRPGRGHSHSHDRSMSTARVWVALTLPCAPHGFVCFRGASGAVLVMATRNRHSLHWLLSCDRFVQCSTSPLAISINWLAPFLPLVQIFRQMHVRDYVQAADMYLRMAIGNAAWPIGVTMVGDGILAFVLGFSTPYAPFACMPLNAWAG